MDIRPAIKVDLKASMEADMVAVMEAGMHLLYRPVCMNKFIINTMYIKILYLMDLFMEPRESLGTIIYSRVRNLKEYR